MDSVQTPHTSREFDQLLDRARELVLEMCARVERQVRDAVQCLNPGTGALAEQVLRNEALVNVLERSIDELVGQIIARRQPVASDLRLLTALIKATTDLERVSDEAKKIALSSRKIGAGNRPPLPRYVEVRHMAAIALEMLRSAIESLEKLDPERTAQIERMDDEVDDAFRAILRQLITFMIEDPRTISGCLDVVFVAKALERVGDHAKNISEYVVYAVKGKDVRHLSVEEIEREVGQAQ